MVNHAGERRGRELSPLKAISGTIRRVDLGVVCSPDTPVTLIPPTQKQEKHKSKAKRSHKQVGGVITTTKSVSSLKTIKSYHQRPECSYEEISAIRSQTNLRIDSQTDIVAGWNSPYYATGNMPLTETIREKKWKMDFKFLSKPWLVIPLETEIKKHWNCIRIKSVPWREALGW